MAAIVADRVAPEPQRLVHDEAFIKRNFFVFDRLSECEHFEDRSELINILRHAVAHGVILVERARIGLVIGQRYHRQHFAGVNIKHNAARGFCLKRILGLGERAGKRELNAHVDGQRDRFVGCANQFIQSKFKSRQAVAVGIDLTHDMRNDAAIGVNTLRAVFEKQAGKPQPHHFCAGVGRQRARDEDVRAVRSEDFA